MIFCPSGPVLKTIAMRRTVLLDKKTRSGDKALPVLCLLAGALGQRHQTFTPHAGEMVKSPPLPLPPEEALNTAFIP